MQAGFVKLDSHLNRYSVLRLQLWTNPAAAVLIYVWALSEVQHNPSGLIMSAFLNVKPSVHMPPWHCKPQIAKANSCDRLSYVACSRRLTHKAAVTALLHDLQTQHATLNSGECLQVVRYPWYATSVLNCCPSWLNWLRSALPLSLTDIDTCMPGKHLCCMCTARVVYYMCTLCCMR